MSELALTTATLRIAVNDVLDRMRRQQRALVGPVVVAVQSSTPWRGGSEIDLGESRGRARVICCASPLEVREALTESEAAATGDEPALPLVVLTPADERQLGQDVLARLARAQLHPLERTQLLEQRFGAVAIDPLLSAASGQSSGGGTSGALLDALLELPPSVQWKAPGGVLDRSHAWGLLLEHALRFTGDPQTLDGWIAWAEREATAGRFESVAPELRTALKAWVEERLGAVARPLFALLEAKRAGDVVPLGLVLRVVPAIDEPEAVAHPSLRDAAIRLEGRLGGALDRTWRQQWAEAAEKSVRDRLRDGSAAAVDAAFRRADELLRELGVLEAAGASSLLPAGFEARARRLGAQLRAVVEEDARATRVALDESFADLAAHERASDAEAQLEAVEMAVRLGRWLLEQRGRPATAAGSFAAAAQRQLDEGAFVDFARAIVADGHSSPLFGPLFRELVASATQQREQQNREFGQLLAGWLEQGSSDGVVPLEEVVGRVVAPLLDHAGVLLLVLDGMSAANFVELARDLEARRFVELLPPASRRLPGIAVLPTETRYSRTSLFCGALRDGDGGVERTGLRDHPVLREKGVTAQLYLKEELSGAGGVGLADEVQKRLESTKRGKDVVAVVVNAIDDWLAKGDQQRIRWGAESIRPLDQLLDAARAGGRFVVLTSDHGHIVERDLERREGDESGARYRLPGAPVCDDEVALRGRRVLAGGAAGIVAPWSERVRYGIRRCGYHGGATPQEVVVPVTVFAPEAKLAGLADFVEVPPREPAWWERFEVAAALPVREGAGSEGVPRTEPAKPRRSTPTAAPVAPPQPLLFATAREESEPVAAAAEAGSRSANAARIGGDDWVARLLATELYAEQRKKAARLGVPDEVVARLLRALDARGKLTRTALARAAEVPAMRLPGYLAALQRLLSIDGYAALSEESTTETVELHRPVLFDQFELAE